MGLATALLTDKDLLFPHFLYVYYLEFFCRKDLSLLFHLFIYPSIYFYQDGLMDICFFLWIITQYSAIYLVIQIVPLWPLEDLLDWLQSPSDIAHLFFLNTHTHERTYLISGTTRCSTLILCFPSPAFETDLQGALNQVPFNLLWSYADYLHMESII